MKRFFTIFGLLALIGLSGVLKAQVTVSILSDDFENESYSYSVWNLYSDDNDDEDWYFYQSALSHNSANASTLDYQNNWLYTDAYLIPNENGSAFSFRSNFWLTVHPDSYIDVYISTDYGSNWNLLEHIPSDNNETNWNNHFHDLNNYLGQYVAIAFVYYTPDAYSIGEIDDFEWVYYRDPYIETIPASSITYSTATAGATLSENLEEIYQIGLCWDVLPNPHPGFGSSNTVFQVTNLIGTFNGQMNSLSPNTQYYYRAFLRSVADPNVVYFGDEMSFTTQSGEVSLTTTAISSITGISAVSGGNITADGGSPVTTRGVCWSTSAHPTTANTYVASGSGIGSFIINLTSLTHNTTYYVRAYATNAVGTTYGNEISFTTAVATDIQALKNIGDLLIYPNPTSDYVIINTGNFNNMTGYTIRIENTLGQIVFENLINQAEFKIDLNEFCNYGMYFVKIIDETSNVLETKKLIFN
jgi:hypothetical protein